MTAYNVRLIVGTGNAAQTLTESAIISLSTHRKLWDSVFNVGNCITGELDALLAVDSADIPRNGRIAVQVRDRDAEQNAPWINKGVFFVFSRERDAETGGLRIVAYDASYRANAPCAEPGIAGTWPKTCYEVMVSIIAARTGANVCAESLELLTDSYPVQYPGIVISQTGDQVTGDGSMTMREVAGYIASMFGGNWTIDNNGEWRLVQVAPLGADTTLLIEESGGVITLGGDKILV